MRVTNVTLDKGSVDLCHAGCGSVVGPLFQFVDGKFLTRSRFAAAVRSVLRQVGPCCSYVCVSILGIASESVLSCVGYRIP